MPPPPYIGGLSRLWLVEQWLVARLPGLGGSPRPGLGGSPPRQGRGRRPQPRCQQGRGVGPSPDACSGKGCKGAKDGTIPTAQRSNHRRPDVISPKSLKKRIGFSLTTKSRNQLRGPKPPPAQQPTIHPSPARRDFVKKK